METNVSSVKFTYEDYLAIPDDGRRHEIIDGDHYVTPAPLTKHQRILINLVGMFHDTLKVDPVGKILVAPCDVVLSNLDVVQPDLLFISATRSSIITERNIQGAPDLAIEILSEGSRRTDELVKKKLYEHFGVQEYWIVDPELETLKVQRLVNGKYVRTGELSIESPEVLTTSLLPSLRINLSEIFA